MQELCALSKPSENTKAVLDTQSAKTPSFRAHRIAKRLASLRHDSLEENDLAQMRAILTEATSPSVHAEESPDACHSQKILRWDSE